jgi:hypothetical protein
MIHQVSLYRVPMHRNIPGDYIFQLHDQEGLPLIAYDNRLDAVYGMCS